MTSTTPAPTGNIVDSTVDTLTATMTPTDLVFLYFQLEGKIRDLTFPKLTLVDIDDAGNHLTGEARRFTCPNCGETESEVISHDVGHRNTAGGAIDDDDKVVSFYYDGGDFRDFVYLCNACRMPVSLPDGWTEE